jgi:hypothetical protein
MQIRQSSCSFGCLSIGSGRKCPDAMMMQMRLMQGKTEWDQNDPEMQIWGNRSKGTDRLSRAGSPCHRSTTTKQWARAWTNPGPPAWGWARSPRGSPRLRRFCGEFRVRCRGVPIHFGFLRARVRFCQGQIVGPPQRSPPREARAGGSQPDNAKKTKIGLTMRAGVSARGRCPRALIPGLSSHRFRPRAGRWLTGGHPILLGNLRLGLGWPSRGDWTDDDAGSADVEGAAMRAVQGPLPTWEVCSFVVACSPPCGSSPAAAALRVGL